jgi:hypothetical protein
LTTSEFDACSSGISIISVLVGDLAGCFSTNIFYDTSVSGAVPVKQDAYAELVVAIQAGGAEHLAYSWEKYLSTNPVMSDYDSVFDAYSQIHGVMLASMDRARVKMMGMKAAYNEGESSRQDSIVDEFLIVQPGFSSKDPLVLAVALAIEGLF